jgi:hypothetical protein
LVEEIVDTIFLPLVRDHAQLACADSGRVNWPALCEPLTMVLRSLADAEKTLELA